MDLPKYFYFRVRPCRKGAALELEDASHVDVAEVVRCKDCANNYVTTRNHGIQDEPRCDFTDRRLRLDDYCSRGVPRDA